MKGRIQISAKSDVLCDSFSALTIRNAANDASIKAT